MASLCRKEIFAARPIQSRQVSPTSLVFDKDSGNLCYHSPFAGRHSPEGNYGRAVAPASLGEILDRTFMLYRRHFLLFVGIAAVMHLVLLVMKLVPLTVTGALSGRCENLTFFNLGPSP
jgi:hypothetical protein